MKYVYWAVIFLFFIAWPIGACLWEYRYWKKGRGDMKFGNPLKIWYLYLALPFLVLLAPAIWIGNWCDNRKCDIRDLAEYGETGLLSWFYIERRLKKDVNLSASLRGTMNGSYLCTGDVEFQTSAMMLIRELTNVIPEGILYGFTQVSDRTILGIIGNRGYLLTKGLEEDARDAEVCVAKALPSTLTRRALVASYCDRHSIEPHFTPILLCGVIRDKEQ